MKIIIIRIEANILDRSTSEAEDFMINNWTVYYHITFSSVDQITGSIEWSAVPVAYKILKFLRQRYDKITSHEPSK